MGASVTASTQHIKKRLILDEDKPFSVLKSGSDLLSHGEAPHYHRRCSVSLLSSVWDQVGPELYGRQTNWCACRFTRQASGRLDCILGKNSTIELCCVCVEFAINNQSVWVLYGQASRAISTG